MKRVRAGSAVMIATVAVAAVAASLAMRPREEAEQKQSTPNLAAVTRADLTVTHTVDGTITFGPPVQLLATAAGTITGLPAVGITVGRGQRLYSVDARPVILMLGTLPAYRLLQLGVRGNDVRELEQNLRALGYGGFSVDDRFTTSTRRAVRRWQRDNGLVQTGTLELGRVVFWPRPVRIASADAVLGQAVTAGAVIGSHTDTVRSVVAEVELELAGLARPGSHVRITVPGRPSLDGVVSTVGSTIQAAADSGTGQEPSNRPASAEPTVTVTVTIADQPKLGGITGAPASVQLIGEHRTGVLTVPVGALLALREGSYGLEVFDGASRRVIAVRTGLFADGRVEVSGASLAPGLRVGTAAG